jgi:hypothetical protein
MSIRFGATDTWANTSEGTFHQVFRLVGGLAPNTSGMTLVSATVGPFRAGTGAGALPIRVAVYSGGSANNPSGATLVEDLGSVQPASGSYAMYTRTSSISPTIPANQYLWIAVKSDSVNDGTEGLLLRTRSDNTNSGDLSSTAGRVNSAGETNGVSAATAFPSTLAGSMSTGSLWYGWSLIYTVGGGGSSSTPAFGRYGVRGPIR